MDENTIKRSSFNDVASFDSGEVKATFIKTKKEQENFEELQKLKQWGSFLEVIYNSGSKNGKISEHEQDMFIELVKWRKSTFDERQLKDFEESTYEEVYKQLLLNKEKGE